MQVGEMCKRAAVTVRAEDGLVRAAELMRTGHVGYLVVTEAGATPEIARPVGVITDRDIVVGAVAKGVDIASLTVGDVMTPEPVTVDAAQPVTVALRQMRRIGVRRLPVVGKQGRLAGVLSMDDVLDGLALQLQEVAGSIRNEQRVETEKRA